MPRSLVAENFAGSADELVIGGVSVGELAGTYGTPLFVYDAAADAPELSQPRRAAVGIRRGSTIRSRPIPIRGGVRLFVEEGAGLEIASVGEYLRARAAGCPPERILFAGPAKSAAELALTIVAAASARSISKSL